VRSFRNDFFEGQVAFVTGGGTGLGFEVSRQLLELGARVVVVASRSREHHERILAEAETLGRGRVESIVLDVREPDRVDEAVRGVAERHGGLDVMINNAAGNFIAPSLRLKSKAWRAVIDIALSGTFYGCQSAGRVMAKRGGGSIVNIAATYAWTGMPGVVHSAAAKAGVVALTRTLAVEWSQLRIRVNAVAPGPFHSDGAAQNLWPDDDARKALLGTIPSGAFASVEEVAESVIYLASRASPSLTGEVLVIDGGQWLGKGLHGDWRGTK
jgi:NAD(P)-dependent dehydrogenase (short-subunit alcohol dehydrogenase family)